MTGIEPELHDDIVQLLPWHAAGTLDEEETDRVDRHLAECDACRAEAQRCDAESAAIRETAVVAPAPHPVGFARLSARIDAAEARRGRVRGWLRSLSERLGLGVSGSPALRWAVVAQLFVIAILAALLLAAPDAPAPEAEPSFRTLSSSESTSTPAGSLRVVFSPMSSSQAVRELLLEVGAEVVAGPSPLGVYTLAMRSESHAAEPLEVVLEHLRASSIVRFAERVDGGGRP